MRTSATWTDTYQLRFRTGSHLHRPLSSTRTGDHKKKKKKKKTEASRKIRGYKEHGPKKFSIFTHKAKKESAIKFAGNDLPFVQTGYRKPERNKNTIIVLRTRGKPAYSHSDVEQNYRCRSHDPALSYGTRRRSSVLFFGAVRLRREPNRIMTLHHMTLHHLLIDEFLPLVYRVFTFVHRMIVRSGSWSVHLAFFVPHVDVRMA